MPKGHKCIRGQARMLLLQFEIPLAVVEYAAEKAGRHALTTILNPAPADWQ